MTNQERFDKFKKVFPTSELTLAKWSKLTVWEVACPTTLRLDMSIFPDTLTAFRWGFTALNHLTFCPTQTKLEDIDLSYVNVNVIKICPEQKSVKRLTALSPITKISFGGSVGTIEELHLSKAMPVKRFALPQGMKSLTKLACGTANGPVLLPKDLTELLEVKLEVGTVTSVKIPNECVKLKSISVVGSFSKLSIPSDLPEGLSLEVDTDVEAFTVPRNAKPDDLRVSCPGDLVISKGSYDKLTTLNVIAKNSIVIPNNATNLTALVLRTCGEATTVIPKAVTGLACIELSTKGDVDIKAPLESLTSLRLVCKGAKVSNAKTMDKVEVITIHTPNDTQPEIKFPDAMPELKVAQGNIADSVRDMAKANATPTNPLL